MNLHPTGLALLGFALANSAPAQALHHVGPGAHATIQAAVDAAAPGDVVVVDAGVYPAFRVEKPLTITAVPSALVQIVSTDSIALTLQPAHRVHLAGLDVQVGALKIVGGIVSAERCTVRTERGLHLADALLALRWCAVTATAGTGVCLDGAHLHASDSTFATVAGSASSTGTSRRAAVQVLGASTCQLALCTLLGAWPASGAAPLPSPALDVAMMAPTARVWLVDCPLIGGISVRGFGPAVVAAPAPAPAATRLHRCSTAGAVYGNVAHGPVVGVHSPVDMQIGASFTTTMLGEPGHLMLLYFGTDILGPQPIFEVEQPSLGFQNSVNLTMVIADAQGAAAFPFAVPNDVALRHRALWWRGLDLAPFPWQATPAFVSVIQ